MKYKNNSKTKILCAYHKRTKLFKSEVVTPVLGGSCLLDETNKNYKWFKKNLLFDNTGENISKYNKTLNEMTVVFWAWKNQDKLNNPQFIGLNHYRRLFDFSNKKQGKFASLKSLYLKNDNKIQQTFEKYDIIARKCNFREVNSTVERIEDYVNTVNLKEKHDGMYRAFLRFKEKQEYYSGNLVIFKKEDFDNYCKTMFDIVIPAQEKMIKENHPEANSRYLACACELLTGFYIDYLETELNFKVKDQKIYNVYEMPKIPFDNIFSIKNEYRNQTKRKVIKLFGVKLSFQIR